MSGSSYSENQENINPNNLSTLSSLNVSSLSELEEMIKGAHPSSLSGKTSQSDLIQKLKALQLIEQMISTQEQLVSGRHGHRDIKQSKQESHLALSRAGNDASPLRASTQHSQQGTAEYSLPSYLSPPLKVPPTDSSGTFTHDLNVKGHGGSFMNDDCTEEVTDLSQSQGIGGEVGHGQFNGCQKDEVEVARPRESQAANQPSLKERREKQLRLLNEKIAQHHSKLPRRTDLTGKTAQASSSLSSSTSKKTSKTAQASSSLSSSASKKTSVGARKPRPQSVRGSGVKIRLRKAKAPAKVAGKSSLHGSESITYSNSIPPSNVPLPCEPPSQAPPTPHLLPSTSKPNDQSTASLQLQHQINSLHLSEQGTHDPSDDAIPLESMSYSQLVESEEMTAATNSSDLLDSTSYLIPVEGEGGDATLVADISAMTDEDTTLHNSLPSDIKKAADVTCEEEDSLASTLTQAYGFSTTSDILSTLASPPRKEQHGSMEDPSANSTMKSSGNQSTVQGSSFSTGSASTMTVDKAATVIQAAWYVSRHLHKALHDLTIIQVQFPSQKEGEGDSYATRQRAKLDQLGDLCGHNEYSTTEVSSPSFYLNIIDICCRYREELAHQASVVQRQEETIQSLMKQVCSLSALYSPDCLKCRSGSIFHPFVCCSVMFRWTCCLIGRLSLKLQPRSKRPC